MPPPARSAGSGRPAGRWLPPGPCPQLQAGCRQPSRPPWSPLPAPPASPWAARPVGSCRSQLRRPAPPRSAPRKPKGKQRSGHGNRWWGRRTGQGWGCIPAWGQTWHVSAHVSRPERRGLGQSSELPCSCVPAPAHQHHWKRVRETGSGSPQPSCRAPLGRGRAASTDKPSRCF